MPSTYSGPAWRASHILGMQEAFVQTWAELIEIIHSVSPNSTSRSVLPWRLRSISPHRAPWPRRSRCSRRGRGPSGSRSPNQIWSSDEVGRRLQCTARTNPKIGNARCRSDAGDTRGATTDPGIWNDTAARCCWPTSAKRGSDHCWRAACWSVAVGPWVACSPTAWPWPAAPAWKRPTAGRRSNSGWRRSSWRPPASEVSAAGPGRPGAALQAFPGGRPRRRPDPHCPLPQHGQPARLLRTG